MARINFWQKGIPVILFFFSNSFFFLNYFFFLYSYAPAMHPLPHRWPEQYHYRVTRGNQRFLFNQESDINNKMCVRCGYKSHLVSTCPMPSLLFFRKREKSH